jgi:hypothetical protein
MASSTFVNLYPGTPPSWREFPVADYDPKAQVGSEEDTLGQLISERTADDAFGITVVAGPLDVIDDRLVKRLAGMQVPTRIQRQSRDSQKPDERVNEDVESQVAGEDAAGGQQGEKDNPVPPRPQAEPHGQVPENR